MVSAEPTEVEEPFVAMADVPEQSAADSTVVAGVVRGFGIVKDTVLGKLTKHGFIGNGLLVRADYLLKKSTTEHDVNTLFAMASQIAKKDAGKAGQILLDIVLNTTQWHENLNQHSGIEATVQDQLAAYQLLIQYDCPQKNQAYMSMVYSEGAFKSAADIQYTADQIEKFGGHEGVSRATFLEEALYSLAVMDSGVAAKLGIPLENIVEAALTLCDVEKTFSADDVDSLPNRLQGDAACDFAGREMQKALLQATSLDEKIRYAALYAKVGYGIGDAGYTSPSFGLDMQPLAKDEVLSWKMSAEPNGYWARLLFNDLQVQTWTDTAQIEELYQAFAAQGIETGAMLDDCLVLLAKNAEAPIAERQYAMHMLSIKGSDRFDIKAILADTAENYDSSCWDVIDLYLRANPELNQGYISQFGSAGFDFGKPLDAAATTPWGQFIQDMQSLDLMSGAAVASLLYRSIARCTPNADGAKQELMYMAAMDPKNDMTERAKCCQRLCAMESDFQYQASICLEENIKDRCTEIRKQVLAIHAQGAAALGVESTTAGELMAEERLLLSLLKPVSQDALS